jgi:diacylglycerol kinase family enzyme
VTWRAGSVVVTNARHYGGDHVIAPAADLEAPSVEVCLFQNTGRLAVLGYGLALVVGRLPELRSVKVISGARRILIRGLEPEPVQGDGDQIGALPVEIDVLPGALRLVYPPA